MLEHAYLIPLIPLAASLIMLFAFKEDTHSPAPWVGIAGMGWCLLQSCAVLYLAASGQASLPHHANMDWFRMPADVAGKAFALTIPLGVTIDGPAAIMLCVVTLVSFLMQVY